MCLALPVPNHTKAHQTTAGVTVEFFLLPLDSHRERVNEWTRYTQIYIHTYIHTYVHTYIHIYIHTYIHIYIRTYIHT